MVEVVALEKNMEAAVEEVVAPPIAKGKRTKRQRLLSPIPITILPPSRLAGDTTPPSSDDSTTTEEENTAWCLVLLSQGHFENVATATCMHTCKTCNRSFSSFQALGGHRASHRKPKNDRKPTLFADDEDFPSPSYLQLSSVSTIRAFVPRMHKCSYCGAEFTSGQALGGHMRKHRGAAPINQSLDLKEAGNGLSLDLNLPVP